MGTVVKECGDTNNSSRLDRYLISDGREVIGLLVIFTVFNLEDRKKEDGKEEREEALSKKYSKREDLKLGFRSFAIPNVPSLYSRCPNRDKIVF